MKEKSMPIPVTYANHPHQDVTTTADPFFNTVYASQFIAFYYFLINTLTIQSGQITDSGGSISFDDENLSTTGTLSTGRITVTGDATGGITINQGADSVGYKSLGYDDQSGKYVAMYVTAGGYGIIAGNSDIFLGYGGNVYTICKSGKSAYVVLGDSSGARSFNVLNSGWSNKFSVDSYGNMKVNGTIMIDKNKYFRPISSADASAPNNSIYYSTTQSKLAYKDSGGTVHVLY